MTGYNMPLGVNPADIDRAAHGTCWECDATLDDEGLCPVCDDESEDEDTDDTEDRSETEDTDEATEEQWTFHTPDGSTLEVAPETGRPAFTLNVETGEVTNLFVYDSTFIGTDGRRTEAVIRQGTLDELRERFPSVRAMALAEVETPESQASEATQ